MKDTFSHFSLVDRKEELRKHTFGLPWMGTLCVVMNIIPMMKRVGINNI